MASPGSAVGRSELTGQTEAARSLVDVVRRGLVAWLPALPLVVIVVALLLAPAVALVFDSLHERSGAWTLANWTETLGRRADQRAILTSLQLGVVCATISLLVGTPLAWWISRMLPAGRSIWLALLNVAANFGGIGLAFGYTAALGTYGMVTLALTDAGIPFVPPPPASFVGLVLAYEYTNVPLFVLLTIPSVGILRREWREAAETAAATRFQFWRYVGLPILAPFLAAGWLLIFTWSMGIYGLAYALAGATTSGQLRLMTLQIGIALNSSAIGPERAAVMGVLLLLFASVSLMTYRLILRWALRWF